MAGADDVLGAGDSSGDDVHLDLQSDPGHAQGVLDTPLVVNDELLGQDMDQLPVQRYGHGLGGVDHSFDVLLGDFPPLDRNHAVTVEAHDVTAGNAGEDIPDLTPGHELSLFQGLLD